MKNETYFFIMFLLSISYSIMITFFWFKTLEVNKKPKIDLSDAPPAYSPIDTYYKINEETYQIIIPPMSMLCVDGDGKGFVTFAVNPTYGQITWILKVKKNDKLAIRKIER